MNDWHCVGTLEDLSPLEGRVVRREGETDLALFRTADDQLFALDDRCPHRGGPLSAGMVHGYKVTCPLHGWTLDLESGQVLGVDQGCINRYPVRLEGNKIYLKLESEHG
ncbi:MAG: nitrite reductase small subunit NirD [Magnetococcales bacterium]|nr:nitrite reductase small subunit NirD [Magnetococcales bacterium]